MDTETAILAAALLVGTVVGWWNRVGEKRRWSRLERVLGMLEQETSVAAALSVARVDGKILRRLPSLERLANLQDALRQRIEREGVSLNMVLSSMEEGVIVVDARQKIRLANLSFIKGFGLNLPPVGRTVLEVLGEPDVHRLILKAREKGAAQERQLEMIPGKRVRYISVRAVPMEDQNRQPGVLAVFRDVTRLQELEQVRREFVSNVSHELRTPLAIFQGYAESLQEIPDMTQEERSEIYAILLKHSNRLNALVEDLLSVGRLEAKKERFVWKLADPGGLARGVVRDWQMRMDARSISVSLEIAEKLPLVRVDTRRIEQVLHNLVENAFKHVPERGGRLTVRVLAEEDGRVVVSVEDNGPGIAPKDLPHIFERFFKADKSRTATAGVNGGHSSGLGLSIVKHIVGAHGGEVGADSPPGRGAHVWFSLPAAGKNHLGTDDAS